MGRGENHKICKRCQTSKSLDSFRHTNSRRVARRTICRDCEAAHKKTSQYKERENNRTKRLRDTDEEYRQKGNAQSRAYGQTPRGRAVRLWNAARQRAKTHKLEFNVPVQLIEFMILGGVCQRTGIPFDLSSPQDGLNFNPYSPSLDRINRKYGYVIGNIQLVCNTYNLAKLEMSDEQFLNFCRLVVNRHG